MTCNYKYTYITHYLSTTVHCAYVVHLGEINPIQKYQKTCLTLCVRSLPIFAGGSPIATRVALPSRLTTKPCYELVSSAILFWITWNQISWTLFTIPTYQNRIICTFIFPCANHVHDPILFSIRNNMHLLSIDSHSD